MKGDLVKCPPCGVFAFSPQPPESELSVDSYKWPVYAPPHGSQGSLGRFLERGGVLMTSEPAIVILPFLASFPQGAGDPGSPLRQQGLHPRHLGGRRHIRESIPARSRRRSP